MPKVRYWNRQMLIEYFKFFLKRCVRITDLEKFPTKDLDNFRDFFARSKEEIVKDLKEAEKSNEIIKRRRLSAKQWEERWKLERRELRLKKKEKEFYEKWYNTEYQSLFYENPLEDSDSGPVWQMEFLDSPILEDPFLEPPFRNKLWDSFVKEYGHTPEEEVDFFFAARRKSRKPESGNSADNEEP